MVISNEEGKVSMGHFTEIDFGLESRFGYVSNVILALLRHGLCIIRRMIWPRVHNLSRFRHFVLVLQRVHMFMFNIVRTVAHGNSTCVEIIFVSFLLHHMFHFAEFHIQHLSICWFEIVLFMILYTSFWFWHDLDVIWACFQRNFGIIKAWFMHHSKNDLTVRP